jgi:hypothetical protein
MTLAMTEMLPPSSEVERIDSEIAQHVKKLSTGNASSEEISVTTRLIRERAQRMMPGAFVLRERVANSNK